MKLIIFGSRGCWVPRWFITDLVMRKWGRLPSLVISGTANGADVSGEAWARLVGVPCQRMPADWDTHGKRAGYLRNSEMERVGDAGLGFWDGKSRGTVNMWQLLKYARKPVHVEVL